MRLALPLPAGFFEVVVSLDFADLSRDRVVSAIDALPLDILTREERPEPDYWSWTHRREAPWPGNYAHLWLRHDGTTRSLHAQLSATVDNAALREACSALVCLLEARFGSPAQTSLWLNADGVYASPSRPLTPERLRLVLEAERIEVDPRFDDPWPTRCLDFRVRGRGPRHFFFERVQPGSERD